MSATEERKASYEQLYDSRARIERVLDNGEWKYTWGLPKDRWGNIDWYNVTTLRKIHALLKDEGDRALALATECSKLNAIVETEVERMLAEGVA